MNIFSKLLNLFSKASKIHEILLIVTVPFNFLVMILTWYSVFYANLANETADLTRMFIAHFDELGLVISFVLFSGSFFLFWSGWIYLSNRKNRNKLEKFGLLVSIAFSMIIFVISIFNLSNDLLVFFFKIDILLPFLSPPLLVVPIVVASVLGIVVFYCSNSDQSQTEDQELKLDEEIRALELFNEKANHLDDLSFTERIRNLDKTKWKFKFEKGEKVKTERKGPKQESIEACVLTLRFFIQDNEDCSLHNLAKIYEDLSISEEKKKSFRRARKEINNYLDQKSHITFGEKELTNRQIFETCIYGGWAHANEKKKEEFDRWMSSVVQGLMIYQFVNISITVVDTIFFIRNLNKEVLEELKT